MSTKDKKIRYGKKDVLSASDFKNPRIRISILLDEEIISGFKERAAENGDNYQTLIRKALREALKQGSEEERIRKIVRQELHKKAS